MFGFLEKANLHPRVRAEFRGVRVGAILSGIFLILAAIVPLIVFYQEFKENLTFYLAYLVGPLALTGAVVFLLIRYWIAPKFLRMSSTMNSFSPQEIRLTGMGMNLRGKELVQLHYPGREGRPNSLKKIWLKTPNEGLFFKKGESAGATVYQDPTARDGFIVIDTGARLLWGEILDE